MKSSFLTTILFVWILPLTVSCMSLHESKVLEAGSLPEWMDDGSKSITFTKNQLKCSTEATEDTTFNALWTGQPINNNQKKLFNFSIVDVSGVSIIGVTSMNSFGEGYKAKGFGTNGINVVNVGTLVQKDYSTTPFKSGDFVSMLVDWTSGKLTITFWHNGRCLGPAYKGVDISSDVPYLYPLVGFKTKGMVNFEAVPVEEKASLEREALKHDGVYGEWASENMELKVRRQGDHAGLNVKVWNTMYMGCRIDSKGTVTERSETSSTMMAGAPVEIEEMEKRVLGMLKTLQSVTAEGDKLHFKSEKDSIVMTPLGKTFTPSSRNELKEAK